MEDCTQKNQKPSGKYSDSYKKTLLTNKHPPPSLPSFFFQSFLHGKEEESKPESKGQGGCINMTKNIPY